MKHEYKIVTCALGLQESVLNQMGAEGWRLVCIDGSGKNLYMERQLPPPIKSGKR